MKLRMLISVITLFLVIISVQVQAIPVFLDGSITSVGGALVATGLAPTGAPPGKPSSEYLADLVPQDFLWELYKDELGNEDNTDFAASYTTAYGVDLLKPTYTSFSITYDDPNVLGPITGQSYLFVKDGNHDPIWYFYDLTMLGWTGTEAITGTNFWTLEGDAISHVAIYGTRAPVPEPATMLLFGIGLVGLVGSRLRKKKK